MHALYMPNKKIHHGATQIELFRPLAVEKFKN